MLPVGPRWAPSPHGRIFWEMGSSTRCGEGRWKLVLQGLLVEGAPPEDDVFLTDLGLGHGRRNLAGEPGACRHLTRRRGGAWRAGIEERWQREWLPSG